MRRRFACWLTVLLALAEPALALAAAIRFDVERDGAGYRVDAAADLAAGAETVWQTLTDYEELPRYMPGIDHVRIVSSADDGVRQLLRMEQAGEAQFLFVRRRIGVLLDVVQEPRSRIVTVSVPRPGHTGDAGVASFEGSYTLLPQGGGVHLTYRARIVPDFRLPPLMDLWLVRHTLARQFDALLAEIERRRLAGNIGVKR